jgi:hypothetical protein
MRLHQIRARLARFIASGGRTVMAASNADTNVGTYVGGKFSATASGAITEFTLVKLTAGTPGGEKTVAANDGVPIGVALTDADTTTEVGVQALGGCDRTVRCIASAAVTVNAILIADSTKVKTLPTAGGTYYIVGTALSSTSADGDAIEMAPCSPVKIVVT